MTAVENLVEETRKLSGYSLKNFENGFKELSDIEKIIQTLIDIALNLQQQLSNLIISKIEPSFPFDEEKNETSASKDEPQSTQCINNYNLSIGLASIYSLVEDLEEKFAAFNAQKSGIAEVYSPSFFLEKSLHIKPDIAEISGTEDLHADLIESAFIIEELNTIYGDLVGTAVERYDLISEKKMALNRSIDLLGEVGKEIYSPTAFLEELPSIKPDIIDALITTSKASLSKEILQKKANMDNDILSPQDSGNESPPYDSIFPGTESTHADLKKSALVINELNTIYNEIVSITAERNQLISEKNLAFSRSIDLFGEVEKEINNKEISRVLDVKGSSDKIHDLSEISGDISKSLSAEILEAYKNTEISSLNKILARTLYTGEVINDVPADADADASRDTSRSSNQVSDFNESLDNISKILHQSISKTHEITDVSVLDKISSGTSQPAELKTSKKEPILFSDQGIFEIPALKPRKKILKPSDDAIANTARLSNAIEMGSHDRETISNSKETISSPFAASATSATSSHSVYAPSIHVSNAFETISDFITTAAGIDRQMSGMIGQSGVDVNMVLRQSHPLDQILSVEGRAALDLHKIAFENSGTTQGRQIMNSGFSMAQTEALEKARLSALNNISLTFPQDGDYRIPSPSMMPPTMENILQIMSGSQREATEGRTESKSVNFQNTFNIVVNVKDGGKETELRDLGKKIGQVLSDEIRRYGGIR